jgi:hypothetical protein
MYESCSLNYLWRSLSGDREIKTLLIGGVSV